MRFPLIFQIVICWNWHRASLPVAEVSSGQSLHLLWIRVSIQLLVIGRWLLLCIVACGTDHVNAISWFWPGCHLVGPLASFKATLLSQPAGTQARTGHPFCLTMR